MSIPASTRRHKTGELGDLHRYLQGSANLFEENRLLKGRCCTDLFGMTARARRLSSTRLTRMPAHSGHSIWVPAAISMLPVTAPSANYLRSITRNIVSLAGTYSAYSADRQFQGVAEPRSPVSVYNGLRDSLNATAGRAFETNPTLSIATYIRDDQPVT